MRRRGQRQSAAVALDQLGQTLLAGTIQTLGRNGKEVSCRDPRTLPLRLKQWLCRGHQ